MKYSECCNAQLMKYDKNWKDGVCIKCKNHSPEKEEKQKQGELTE